MLKPSSPTGRVVIPGPEPQHLPYRFGAPSFQYKTDHITPEIAQMQLDAYRDAFPRMREIVMANYATIEERVMAQYMGMDLDPITKGNALHRYFDATTNQQVADEENTLTLEKLKAIIAGLPPKPAYDTLAFSPWMKRPRLKVGMMWCPWAWQYRSELIEEINKTPILFRVKIRIMGPMGSRSRRRMRQRRSFGGVVNLDDVT